MDNLGGLLRFPLNELPFVFLALVLALTLHEFAHAYVADRFGDPTPRSMGRVTLNPMAHLDLLGTIFIFIVGFGWAKPVWIRPSNFKNPRAMSIAVAVAGPLSNILLAFIGMLAVYSLVQFGVLNSASVGVLEAVHLFLKLFIQINLVLFLFNLLPIPPLDGYRILQEFLPLRAQLKVREYEQWGVYLFLLFVLLPPLYRATLAPLFQLVIPHYPGSYPIFSFLDRILQALFGVGIDWLRFFYT